jgi:hypothetical protein
VALSASSELVRFWGCKAVLNASIDFGLPASCHFLLLHGNKEELDAASRQQVISRNKEAYTQDVFLRANRNSQLRVIFISFVVYLTSLLVSQNIHR